VDQRLTLGLANLSYLSEAKNIKTHFAAAFGVTAARARKRDILVANEVRKSVSTSYDYGDEGLG